MSKFTKGPWKFNGNEIVAESDTKTGIGGFMKYEDSCLAAAAPDMYEALISLLADDWLLELKQTHKLVRAFELAQDALARASCEEE